MLLILKCIISMLIQLYKFSLTTYKNEVNEVYDTRYVCGAIAKYNGNYSTNYILFTSNINEQIALLTNGYNMPPYFFRDIWSVDNFHQIYDDKHNALYKLKYIMRSNCVSGFIAKCKIIIINSNPSIFLSSYTQYFFFREEYNYRNNPKHSYHEPVNPDLSQFDTIYIDNNNKVMHSITSQMFIEHDIKELWKINFKFPERKKFSTDCSLICVK